MQSRLSQVQEDLLRHLTRQTGPVPEDHLDGRVVRALAKRGFISLTRGWISATDGGLAALNAHVKRENAKRIGSAAGSPRHARAEAIRRAVDDLEAAIPRDAEVMVNGNPAYADDIVAGLWQFSRRLADSETAM